MVGVVHECALVGVMISVVVVVVGWMKQLKPDAIPPRSAVKLRPSSSNI